jgi:hypothetical protein
MRLHRCHSATFQINGLRLGSEFLTLLQCRTIVVCVVLLLSLCKGANAKDNSKIIYVDINNGSKDNPGTQGAPLETLEQAKSRARELISDGMSDDVKVIIRQGTYYLAAPLVFDQRDSGRNGFKVIYCAVDGEKVDVVGGQPVTGWRPYKGSIYKADVGKGKTFNALFENGRWATLARSPNKGYHRVKTRTNDPCAVTFGYDANSVPSFNHKNANVVIWAGSASFTGDEANYDWYTSTVPIAKADLTQHSITLKDQTWWKVSPHNRYYIQGAKEFVDSPGEWYYDSKEGVLYYWPLTTPIDKQEVVMPCATNVIVCSGSSMAKPASDITFEGLTFRNSDFCNWFGPGSGSTCKGFMYFANARNVSVINCAIRNAGYNGIAMHNYSKDHIIRDCVIEGCGVNGISVAGYDIGAGPFLNSNEAYVNQGHLIRNNHIRSCGKLVGQGSGILLYQAGDIDIANNLIEDMPRYGINMIGMSYSYLLNPRQHGGFGGELYGQKITWDNRMQFLYCRNIRIVRNEFRDLMKDSQDGGAITAWAVGANNLIEENFIHDFTPTLFKGSYVGIYLDDASSYFTVRKNVITRLGASLYVYPLQIKGLFNTVTNNIIANNDATAGVCIFQVGLAGNPDSPPGIKDEKVGQLIFTKNVFYNNKGKEIYRIYPWRNDIVETSNDNIVYNTNRAYAVMIDWKLESWQVWKKRQDGKYDTRSAIVDPCMTEPAADNYIFKPHSIAHRLGIEDVNLANVGLLKER